MMPRYYAKFLGGAAKIDDLVGLSPSSHDTTNPLAPRTGATCPAWRRLSFGAVGRDRAGHRIRAVRYFGLRR